jgi:histidine triad (HIT) family protein
MTTIFEKLLSGEFPCAKVYEDDLVFAFMDAGQVNDGHVIVASKKPYETILDIDEETTQRLFLVAKRIAHVVQDAFKAEGITLLQANKDAGWHSVPHIHVHVLPRYKNDGVELVWPRKEPGIERLKELAKLIQVPSL